MQKEVLIYGYINDYSSTAFIEEINKVIDESPKADIVVRVNSPGGSVEYGWGMIAKFKELSNKKSVKVDGKAHSMGFYFCAYADEVEALDVSEFLLHRAAYPSWIEKDPDYFNEDMRNSLKKMNDNLRKAVEAKINVQLFEEITGQTLDDVFSMEGQLNVRLTAQQAKKIGLVQNIIKITPQKKAEIKALMAEALAFEEGAIAEEKTEIQKPSIKMTTEQLKSEHPNVYAQVFELGKTEGQTVERDRVEACLTFIEADPKGVSEAIASGKPLSQKQMAEFSMKVFNSAKLKEIEKESEKNNGAAGAGAGNESEASAETKEQKEKKNFLADVMAESVEFKPTKK